MMSRRVILVALPELMEDLVRRACSAAPDLDVTASIDDMDKLPDELMRQDADVVIAGLHGTGRAGRALSILDLRPELRVLLITLPGVTADLFELQPQHLHLGTVSPHEIVQVLQSDQRHAQGWSDLKRALDD